MTPDELLFFDPMPGALPLYEVISGQLRAAFPDVTVKVRKTQITFAAKFGFAFVSLHRMKGCPEVFLILSFGLRYRLDSPRVAAAAEPYPNRWTHHVIVSDRSQIDDELMGWLREAHDFALTK